jgi:glycerophosphoryl diester phosphodiesterase
MVRDRTLGELRAVAPELPTLDEALRFFVDEAPSLGAHVDLKVAGREGEIADALRAYGLEGRTLVSSGLFRAARRFAKRGSGTRFGITFPRVVLGISDENRGAPIARTALRVLRRLLPPLVPILLASSRATVLVVHHSIVSAAAVRAAHARGAAVVAWTVDRAEDLARVDSAGVDAVVTNDPFIFASTMDT